MKKILLFILIFLFVCGCSKNEEKEIDTVYYNLDISNVYKENIDAIFGIDAYKLADDTSSDIPPLEYIFLYEDINPIFNNHKVLYDKDIIENDDNIEVKLNYTFIEDDFITSNYVQTCFEKYDIKSSDNYIDINLSGSFYCLHDKIFIISVKSPYTVLESNGTKDDEGYFWIIDKSNVDNVSIKYKIKRNVGNMIRDYNDIKEESNTKYISIIIFGILVLFIILIRVRSKK